MANEGQEKTQVLEPFEGHIVEISTPPGTIKKFPNPSFFKIGSLLTSSTVENSI